MKKLAVDKKLGSGAFAEVYRAKDNELDRYVAIKLIRPEYAELEAITISQGKTLATLEKHANLVQIYAVGEAELTGELSGRFLVVEMEWVNGESLAGAIRGPSFTANQCRAICAGIIAGVKHMHNSNIVHGDLHPGNVILAGGNHPVIIDAANRHKMTIFRTTFANTLELKAMDVDAVKFCLEKTILHAKIPAALASILTESIKDSVSLGAMEALVSDDGAWSSQSIESSRVTTVTKTLASVAIQFCENRQFASLRELAISKTRELAERIRDDEQFPMDAQVNVQELARRIDEYERITSEAASIAAMIAAWSESEVADRIVVDMLRTLQQSADEPYMKGVFKRVWSDMRSYPLLLLFYSVCFGCYRNGRFELLRKVLFLPAQKEPNLLQQVNIVTIDLEIVWNDVNGSRRYTPASDRMAAVLPSVVPSLAMDPAIAEEDFDELQSFLSCAIVDQKFDDANAQNAQSARRSDGLKGRFLWRYKEQRALEKEATRQILAQANREGRSWPPLAAGFFQGDSSRALKVLDFAVAVHDRFRRGFQMD